MGAITNKCFELLESAGNYEERRSTGIIIQSNWFDAIDCGTGEATPNGEGDKKEDSGDIQKCRNKDLK